PFATHASAPPFATYASAPPFATYASASQYVTHSSAPPYVTYASTPPYATYASDPMSAMYPSAPPYAMYTSTSPPFVPYMSAAPSFVTNPVSNDNNNESPAGPSVVRRINGPVSPLISAGIDVMFTSTNPLQNVMLGELCHLKEHLRLHGIPSHGLGVDEARQAIVYHLLTECVLPDSPMIHMQCLMLGVDRLRLDLTLPAT
ncbi:hypothetical protein B0H12DRAFT_1028578, partial [Mycena haematopus]